ncbi:MAG: hypothetical protein ACOYL9_04565 [Ilumatobacteraceae bacterium]|jgi:hypothetical protein
MSSQVPPRATSESVPIAEVIDLVKEYARQETVGPLKGAGRWLAYGAAGSLLLGAAAVFAVLGLLRLVQNEFGETFSGRWMALLPYLFALLVSIAIIGIALSRIKKSSLHGD